MAKTNGGVEFYLVQVQPETHVLEEVEAALRPSIRGGDALFSFESELYIAFAADVRGTGHATRRLLRVIRESGVGAKTRLVPEPFPEGLWNVASKVITGEVSLKPRESDSADKGNTTMPSKF